MEEQSPEIASLIESLHQENKRGIRAAVDALISLGRGCPAAVEKLERLLIESSEEKRWPIAHILAHIPRVSALALAALIKSLGHSDPDIRWATEVLLVRLAKNDESIVPGLLELATSGSAIQKRMALYSLRDLHLTDSVSLGKLVEAVRDPDPLVRVAAIICLKARPEAAKETVDILLQVLFEDSDPRVQSSCAIVLAHLGEPVEKILTAIERACQSGNAKIRKAANAARAILDKKRPA